MKNANYKCQQVLQILTDLNLLREDACLFSKIALFDEKKARWGHFGELVRVEEARVRIEEQLEGVLEEFEMNEFWKTLLFQFSNRLYKNIKAFHQKLTTFSGKVAEISETNAFLQGLRNSCIERLAEAKNIGQFVRPIMERLRQRVLREFSVLSNFGVNSKVIELARREQSSRSNRFLGVIKPKESELFHRCHRNSLAKLESQCKRLLSREPKSRNEHPMYMLSQLLDLEEENSPDRNYQAQNGMFISLAYKDEGFCEFITTKYYRIVKDLLNRNGFNQRSINRFREKYEEVNSKPKKAVKSSTVYNDCFKKSQKRSQVCNEEEFSNSIQMKNITNLDYPQNEEHTINEQQATEIPKKSNIFKIQKLESRKKSHTLRPLVQSKENNKEVVHQRVIEMKLEEEPLQIAKILRIRKRKHIPIFREENAWSLIVKQNKSKISFLIH